MDDSNPNADTAPKRRPRVTEARETRDLEGAASGPEAFDRHRVEAIRTAIAKGRYHVAPGRLAERFLELENLLNQ